MNIRYDVEEYVDAYIFTDIYAQKLKKNVVLLCPQNMHVIWFVVLIMI